MPKTPVAGMCRTRPLGMRCVIDRSVSSVKRGRSEPLQVSRQVVPNGNQRRSWDGGPERMMVTNPAVAFRRSLRSLASAHQQRVARCWRKFCPGVNRRWYSPCRAGLARISSVVRSIRWFAAGGLAPSDFSWMSTLAVSAPRQVR